MTGPTSPTPNITDYTTFIQNVMGIGANYLPTSSPAIQHSFDVALNWVSCDLGQAISQPTSWSPYAQAVYNLGGALLIEYCPDQSYSISAASWNSGLVTITTAVPNAIVVNDVIAINGISPSGYNGVFAVNSIIDASDFTYARVATAAAQLNTMLVGVPNTGPAISVAGATVSETFFLTARRNFKITSFVPGVPGSASDQGTSVGLVSPNFTRGLTLFNLQLTKTPYGLTYLRIAQTYGPTIWGLS